jgi:hypothetical protein
MSSDTSPGTFDSLGAVKVHHPNARLVRYFGCLQLCLVNYEVREHLRLYRHASLVGDVPCGQLDTLEGNSCCFWIVEDVGQRCIVDHDDQVFHEVVA